MTQSSDKGIIDGVEFEIDPEHFIPPGGFHSYLLQEFDRLDGTGGNDTKHLYAAFGLAVYLSQNLELTFGNIALLYDGLTGKIKYRHEADAFDALFNKKTLGAMLNEVRKRISWNDATHEVLVDVLSRRNTLAHRFFSSRVTQFATRLGRRQMVKYLIECADRFHAADVLLSSLASFLGTFQEGRKPEHYKGAYAQLLEEARRIEAAETAEMNEKK